MIHHIVLGKSRWLGLSYVSVLEKPDCAGRSSLHRGCEDLEGRACVLSTEGERWARAFHHMGNLESNAQRAEIVSSSPR